MSDSHPKELVSVTGRHVDYEHTDHDAAATAADRPVVGVDLDADPFDDNLDDELRVRAPARFTRATLALGGLVLVVGGFVGGVLVQKNLGTSGTATPNALPTGAFAGLGQNGGRGQNGTGQTGGTATTGTVKLVDGTTLYVTTADGSVVIVKTQGTTTVRTEQTTALKDLKAGTQVTVQGTTGSDGVVNATQVTARK